MNKYPTKKDYRRLVKTIANSGKVNTFDLQDLGYKGECLDMFIEYRFDLLLGWLQEFIEFEEEKPFLKDKKGIHVCWRSTSGMSYEVHSCWENLKVEVVDYYLFLYGYEDFIRAEYPTVERRQLALATIYNRSHGYESIARCIIEAEIYV